jgi:hypothetical protein
VSPDRRNHRGAHPEDAERFAEGKLAALRAAVDDLGWLLGKGYTESASLKLVGDRHGLDDRQRRAVARAACTDMQRQRRVASRLGVEALGGADILVDGFNLLITVEAALSGGVLLLCRDDSLRDLASVHGTYRSVEETGPALELIGSMLAAARPARVRWLLDSPVSNSGRLAARMRELSAERGWHWEVEAVASPDAELIRSAAVALTTDSNILDLTERWCNFAAALTAQHVPDAWTLDLRP